MPCVSSGSFCKEVREKGKSVPNRARISKRYKLMKKNEPDIKEQSQNTC